MPIAQCLTRPTLVLDAERVAAKWAQEAPFAADEITVVTTVLHGLGGKPYDVLARLTLPSLWSAEKVEELQLALARALEAISGSPRTGILVLTEILGSGHVVEGGRVLHW